MSKAEELKSKYTVAFELEINKYIQLGFNQDEVNGFMNGFLKGYEAHQSRVNAISDEDIRKNASDCENEYSSRYSFYVRNGFLDCAKWFKEQLLKQ